MENEKVLYQTSPAVFYRNYDGKIFLRNVATRYEYHYNEIVGDILDILKTQMNFEDLISRLSDIYRVKNAEEFRKDIKNFLDNLVKKSVVLSNLPYDTVPHSSVFQQMADTHNAKRQFWSACLEITYRCTEKCRHCYLDDEGNHCKVDELTFDEYKKVVDELYDMGCMNILVTGGEPTLHPDFLKICRYIVDKGILLDVFTNALHIPDDMFEALCDMHLNCISFSLYGGSPEFHDYITQVPGSFHKTLHNILKFKAAGLDLYVKTILFKDKYDEWLKLDALSQRLNFRLNTATFLLSTREKEDRCHMMQTDDEYRQYLRLVRSRERGPHLVPRRNVESYICTAGRSSLAITANGDVRPCASVPYVLGNVRTDHLKDIWESEKLMIFYQFKYTDLDTACKDCKYSNHCSICLGDAYDEKTGKLSKCSYTCRHAKLRYEEDQAAE